VNAVEALDDYLVELLAEVTPAAPAPVQAPLAVQAAPFDLDANAAALLAEMDADPAFAPAKPVAVVAAPALLDLDANTAALLAEMDADPAFAPAKPAAAVAAPALLDLDANAAALLAEMDADPAFAPAKPVAVVAAPALLDLDANAAALLAEMDADPAFAGVAPAAPGPRAAKPTAAPITPIARRPTPRSPRLPANIQALFQPAPQADASHRRAADRTTRWLRLRCGGQTYALELLKVQEVVLPVPLLPLRGAARSFLGIMNLRGQVVPVLDLGIHLGAGAVAQDAQTRVVVLEENGETMGLRVSAVDDVASLTDQQIEPPDTTRLCRISNHLFRGVARIAAQPVILLDATQLLH